MSTTTSIQADQASLRRPVIITILCVLGMIAAAGNMPAIFADAARNVGAWFPPFLAFSACLTVVCMIGLWKMRRWAIFVYTGWATVTFVMAFPMGVWNLTALLVRVAFIAVMFSQLPKMR